MKQTVQYNISNSNIIYPSAFLFLYDYNNLSVGRNREAKFDASSPGKNFLDGPSPRKNILDGPTLGEKNFPTTLLQEKKTFMGAVAGKKFHFRIFLWPPRSLMVSLLGNVYQIEAIYQQLTPLSILSGKRNEVSFKLSSGLRWKTGPDLVWTSRTDSRHGWH